jgi:hypothetical protein
VLENNITYAFDKTHSVKELINPDHSDVRKVLADDDKLRGIIKTSDKPRPPKIAKIIPVPELPTSPVCALVIEEILLNAITEAEENQKHAN